MAVVAGGRPNLLLGFARDRIDDVIAKLEQAIDKLLDYISQTVIYYGFDEYEAILLTDMLVSLVQHEIERLEEYLAYAKRLKQIAEKLDDMLKDYEKVVATNYDINEFYTYYV